MKIKTTKNEKSAGLYNISNTKSEFRGMFLKFMLHSFRNMEVGRGTKTDNQYSLCIRGCNNK